MERIIIDEEDKKIIINIQGKLFNGYSFYNDGKIKILEKNEKTRVLLPTVEEKIENLNSIKK